MPPLSVQRTSAVTRSYLSPVARSRAPLGALWGIMADIGVRPARSFRTAPSSARAATTSAAAPQTTAVAQAAMTTHASTASLWRRSGLRRHRQPRTCVRLGFHIVATPVIPATAGTMSLNTTGRSHRPAAGREGPPDRDH